MKFIPLAISLVISMTVASCASVKQYDGPDRPKSELAVITKEASQIHFRKVNGQPQGLFGDEVRVLPGPTVLTIGYHNMNLVGTKNQRISFVAVAGKEYELKHWRSDMRWGSYLLDKQTHQEIARGEPE